MLIQGWLRCAGEVEYVPGWWGGYYFTGQYQAPVIGFAANGPTVDVATLQPNLTSISADINFNSPDKWSVLVCVLVCEREGGREGGRVGGREREREREREERTRQGGKELRRNHLQLCRMF